LIAVAAAEHYKSAQLESKLAQAFKINAGIKNEAVSYQQKLRAKIMDEAVSTAQLLKVKSDIEKLMSGFKKEKIINLQLKEDLQVTQNLLISAMKARSDSEKKLMETTDKQNKATLERVIIKAGPVLTGSVLVINKDDGFAVIDLGRRSGLEAGTIMGVLRNNAFIARLVVVAVEENVSILNIVPSWRNIDIIKEGDRVKSF